MNQTTNIIRAAKHYRQWGREAVQAFAAKRDIPMRLIQLARQLEAAKRAGFH